MSAVAALAALAVVSRAVAGDAFVDVTQAAKIDLVHTNGARGEKVLVETMAGGGGWLDFDGDGWLDFYFVDAHDDSRRAAEKGAQGDRLLRNRGDGTFEDATERARLGDRGYGNGIAVGDIDNDGDSDLYITNYGANSLYLNEGGVFRDATSEAGVACGGWSMSAAFADIDGDGFLDLYVTRYLVYDAARERPCFGDRPGIPSYCHPNKFAGAADVLLRNRGDGRFEDISQRAGIAVTGRGAANGLGVLPTDFDRDGDVDFFVANDSVPNFLWRNLGGLRFEDAALEAGVALDANGKAQACMGIDGADLNGDGAPDYYLTNFSQETDVLYSSLGDGFYEDATGRAGLAEPTYMPLAFGTGFVDFDLDGDLDIFVACGHILDNVEELNPGKDLTYAQTPQLFENNGSAAFRDVSRASGRCFLERHVSRAAAFADYDNDGDLDVLLVNVGSRAVLLQSRAAQEPGRHWIGLDLEAPSGPANRDGYQSVVRVSTPLGPRVVEVRSARSYLSANDPRVLVGLGGSSAAVGVEVRWPDGLVEGFDGLAPDRYHRLVRGSGRKRS